MPNTDIRATYERLRGQIEKLHADAARAGAAVAIMFCDLVNSTAYKAKRDQVVALLKTFRHNVEIETQVKKFNGRIVKSLGDGILATFELEEPDDIYQPIEAAIRILTRFQKLNQSVVEEERILTRIGLAAGVVVNFKALDPDGASVNDPQGSPVDLAARLCSLAKPEQVLCDESLVSLLNARRARYELFGPFQRQLKGFADPAELYALKWGNEASSTLAQPDPTFHESGFLTVEFVLSQLRSAQRGCRVVGHSHRLFCNNVDLLNIVTEKVASNGEFAFELTFLNPFSPFKGYSELITRRQVADLRPDILRNIRAACSHFAPVAKNVKIVAALYPMAIPVLHRDSTVFFSLPFRAIARPGGGREGVVGGPYFEVHEDSSFGARLVRHVGADTGTEVPMSPAVPSEGELEDLLRQAVQK